jgi:hypothetical protein
MFQSKDFSECLIDPTKDNLKENSVIKSYSEFKLKIGLIPMDTALRYIVSVYDKHSPFRKKYDDIVKRKTEAALFAGFSVNDFNEFDEKYYEILVCRNENFNKMIVRYCRLQYSSEYSYLATMEDLYYKQLDAIRMEQKVDPKQIKQAKDEITITMEKMLMGDKNMNMQHDLLKVVDDDNLDIFPEDIADKISKGEPPLGRHKA